MQAIVSQAISIVGMIVGILSFQSRSNKYLFILQAGSAVCFAVSFLLLGSYTASVLNFINIFRGWAFGFAPKKYHTALTVTLILMFTAATVFTYGGWLSILVLIAQIVGTAVMRTDSGKIIRIAQLAFVSPAWLTHNILCGSIGAIFCEVFNIMSIIVSIARFGINGFTGTDGTETDAKK